MADENRSEIAKDEPQATPDVVSNDVDGESAEVRARREARRRVLAGGLASAPLILTLASRPALATWGGGGGHDTQKCGYSGVMSGNLSNTDTATTWCKGKPPKYWKTRQDSCDRHFNSGPCNPIYLDYVDKDYSVPTKTELKKHIDKLKKNYYANWYKIQECEKYMSWLNRYPNLNSPPFGSRFSEVFGSGIASNSKLTVMQALWLDDESPHPPSGNDGPSPLLAHCAAAYCNACEYGEDSYGFSARDIVDMIRSEISSDPFGLEEKLKFMNDQG